MAQSLSSLVALTALLLATAAATAAADDSEVPLCTYAELGTLTTNKNRTLCAKETGIDMSTLTGTPTDAQLQLVCDADACVALVNAILEINPDDCTLPTNTDLQLMSEFVDPAVKYCSAQGVSFITPNSSDSDSGGVDVGDDDSASASASGSVGSGSSAATSVVASAGAIAVASMAVMLAL